VCPVRLQARTLRSLSLQKFLPIERRVPCEHVLDRAGQLLGQYGQRFALSVFVLQPGQVLLADRIVPQKQHGGFGKRPLQIGVADLGARKAGAFARGFRRTLTQTAIGDKILDPGKALDVMHLLQEHQAEDFANSGSGLEEGQGLRLVVLGGFNDRSLHIAEQRLVGVKQRQVPVPTLLARRIRNPLGDASAVRFVGQLCPDRREVVLTMRVLDMGQELGAFARQVHPASEQVARRPHLSGIHIGLREHTAAEEDSNLLGVDLVILRFATMDCLHIEGVAEHKRAPFPGAEISQPVPGEDTCDGHDDLAPIGRKGLEQSIGTGLHVAVQHDLAVLTQDTDVHGAGMQVDAAGKWVLLGIESHEVSSSCA
jgi:hypothetical protein